MGGPLKPFFFIVGSARSGTTLLRLMLNSHSQIAVPPESRFVVDLWRGRDEVDVDEFLRDLQAHARWPVWDLSIQAVRAELHGRQRVRYGDAIEAPYRAYAAMRGKSRWGDKTPRYIENIPFLASLFPHSRFIQQVRDGRDVALSYADVPFGPNTVAKAAQLWARRVSLGLAASRLIGSDRYLQIRYENFVANPESELKRLCDFLEVGFEAEMLDYQNRARDEILPRAARYNPNIANHPITEMRAWQEEMDPRHVEIFEAVAGDVLSELGYVRHYPNPTRLRKASAALGRAGLPVGRLKSSRPI